MIYPWKFLAPLEAMVPMKPSKTFVQAVSAAYDMQSHKISPKVVVEDIVRIKISQDGYAHDLEDCSRNLHVRVTLQKHDSPLTAKILNTKLMELWYNLSSLSVTPLGRGCYEFQFQCIEEMRKALAQGIVNLKPRIWWFFCWSKFSIHKIRCTDLPIFGLD